MVTVAVTWPDALSRVIERPGGQLSLLVVLVTGCHVGSISGSLLLAHVVKGLASVVHYLVGVH